MDGQDPIAKNHAGAGGDLYIHPSSTLKPQQVLPSPFPFSSGQFSQIRAFRTGLDHLPRALLLLALMALTLLLSPSKASLSAKEQAHDPLTPRHTRIRGFQYLGQLLPWETIRFLQPSQVGHAKTPLRSPLTSTVAVPYSGMSRGVSGRGVSDGRWTGQV